MTVHPKNLPLPLPLLPLPLLLPPGKRVPRTEHTNYEKIAALRPLPLIPRTRPLPAPIAAPPRARSKIELPVLMNKGLDDTRRGKERRRIRTERVG